MGFIKVENLFFSYSKDSDRVLKNINLNIIKGEKVSIIGQNGAGKTTLMKIFNGLLKPTNGNVIIDGLNTKENSIATMSKKVGYVFQNPMDQIFNNTVYKEISYGAKILKYDEEKKKRLIDKAVKLTNIEKYLDENPYNVPFSLSKFITIASVIIMDSDIIVLDEPTAGQDSVGIETLENLIKILNEEGKTIVTITHDMDFVANNFDRVVVMSKGEIISDDNLENTFYNEDILKKAYLNKPKICDIVETLNIGRSVFKTDDIVEEIIRKSNANTQI